MGDFIADAGLASWICGLRSQPAAEHPPDLARLRAARFRSSGPELFTVADLMVPGAVPVAVRLYRPEPGPLPLVVFVHGGGFVSGDLESHDRTCRRMASGAGVVVLAVHYRRAPEHPAPAAVDDVVFVLRWAAAGPAVLGRVQGHPGVAGDSAGGLIALLAADRTSMAGSRLGPLLLVCPNADLTLSRPSILEKGSGWGLDNEDLKWFVSRWVPGAPDAVPAPVLARFSPLHVSFGPLPATIIATAEHDPLRDEGSALVRRLRESGTDVRGVAHAGLVHGFLSLDTVSPAALAAGDRLLRLYGEALRSAGAVDKKGIESIPGAAGNTFRPRQTRRRTHSGNPLGNTTRGHTPGKAH